MSSVKRNGAVQDSLPSAELPEKNHEPDPEWLYADLADGLHAMAQPLTILRSAITMLSRPGEPGSNRDQYLQLSARQIERTCILFASIRSLLAARLEPAANSPFDIQKLLTRTIEAQSLLLQEHGIKVVVANPESSPLILGDPYRTGQAIAGALETASSLFSPGDTIEITVFPAGDFVEVIVKGRQDHSKTVSSFERVNLSLVKAHILSQRGKYQLIEEPFCVTLALPARKPDLKEEEVLSLKFAHSPDGLQGISKNLHDSRL
jgi:hypothetical protein